KAPFNVLHLCGTALDFKRFANYPVQVMNWADRHVGPPITEVAGTMRPAICAGLDHLGTMVKGSPSDCVEEIRDAVKQAGGRPNIRARGCTFDPATVPEQNLRAIRRAVDDLK